MCVCVCVRKEKGMDGGGGVERVGGRRREGGKK